MRGCARTHEVGCGDVGFVGWVGGWGCVDLEFYESARLFETRKVGKQALQFKPECGLTLDARFLVQLSDSHWGFQEGSKSLDQTLQLESWTI